MIRIGRVVPALLLLTVVATRAFSHPSHSSQTSRRTLLLQRQQQQLHAFLMLRGGQQEDEGQVIEVDEPEPPVAPPTPITATPSASTTTTKSALALPAMTGALQSVGAFYASCLQNSPIFTKSITAGCIFAVSDYLAQRLEASASGGGDKKGAKATAAAKKRLNVTRIATSAAVGLLYFGPAAHYWYSTIFKLLPGTSLVSTLQKAALGQAFFGPSFTCIFFATSLLQTGQFTPGNWGRKIRRDLPGAWLAGAGFWPIVDLVSYSLIAQQWIPLFVNMCSLVWTIYLSTIANRATSA